MLAGTTAAVSISGALDGAGSHDVREVEEPYECHARAEERRVPVGACGNAALGAGAGEGARQLCVYRRCLVVVTGDFYSRYSTAFWKLFWSERLLFL